MEPAKIDCREEWLAARMALLVAVLWIGCDATTNTTTRKARRCRHAGVQIAAYDLR